MRSPMKREMEWFNAGIKLQIHDAKRYGPLDVVKHANFGPSPPSCLPYAFASFFDRVSSFLLCVTLLFVPFVSFVQSDSDIITYTQRAYSLSVKESCIHWDRNG